MVHKLIFDCCKNLLKFVRVSPIQPQPEFKCEPRTLTAGPGTSFHYGQPAITFTTNPNLTWKTIHPPINQLIVGIVSEIDNKSLSDYEFREWLRDNLSSCEYQSENGLCRYVKDVNTKPISVIDTMLEVNK